MKKVLLIAIAILLVGSFASAAVLTGTFGDQNSSKAYRVQVDNAGTVTFASDTSIVYPYAVSAITLDTLATTDSGKWIVNTNPIGQDFRLPRAAAGLNYCIVDGKATGATSTYISIDTLDTSDTILKSIASVPLVAGGSLKSTGQTGDTVCVFSSAANVWQVIDETGAWTAGGIR